MDVHLKADFKTSYEVYGAVTWEGCYSSYACLQLLCVIEFETCLCAVRAVVIYWGHFIKVPLFNFAFDYWGKERRSDFSLGLLSSKTSLMYGWLLKAEISHFSPTWFDQDDLWASSLILLPYPWPQTKLFENKNFALAKLLVSFFLYRKLIIHAHSIWDLDLRF